MKLVYKYFLMSRVSYHAIQSSMKFYEMQHVYKYVDFVTFWRRNHINGQSEFKDHFRNSIVE